MSGMKRPEGFDKQAPEPRAHGAGRTPKPGRAAKATRAPRDAGAAPGAPARSSPSPRPSQPARSRRSSRTAAAVPQPRRPTARPERPAKPVDPIRLAQRRAKAEAAAARREAGVELRRATRERKRYEKAEVRRFTARARARRAAGLTTLAVVGALVVLGLIAIFSPILALRTIVVQGTSRVDPTAVQTALDGQLGTPLALISGAKIDAALSQFPIVQSYSTEMIPPGTMVVNLVERQPVATVQQSDGSYRFVDAAGVTVQQAADRLPGVPLITDSGGDLPNATFSDAVEVLLALPDALRAQVDTITAKSHDDVTLTLVGAAQSVEWGSADDSDRKAELLAALQRLHGGQPGTFDVSAIDDGIFRAS